jgi:hypothetical protein
MTELEAAALAVVCAVSRRTLRKRTAGFVKMDRQALMRLAAALEREYPGLIDHTFDRIEAGEG